VEGDEVGVVQRRRGARLALEAGEGVGVGGVAGGEELDRDVAVELGILGEVDLAHPSFADLGDNTIVRYRPADHGLRGPIVPRPVGGSKLGRGGARSALRHLVEVGDEAVDVGVAEPLLACGLLEGAPDGLSAREAADAVLAEITDGAGDADEVFDRCAPSDHPTLHSWGSLL
jgi:hypothetical protein